MNLHIAYSQTRKHCDKKQHFTFQEQTAISQAYKLVIKATVPEGRLTGTCSVTLSWKHYNCDTLLRSMDLSGDHNENH